MVQRATRIPSTLLRWSHILSAPYAAKFSWGKAKRATLDDRIAHPVLVEEVTSTGQVWVGGSALECCHPLVDRFLPQGNRFVCEARDEGVVA